MRRLLLAAFLAVNVTMPAMAADVAPTAAGAPPIEGVPLEGVACGDPVVQAFPEVWLGRFQGGFSHYVGEGGPVVVDWRQERLCFPDRVSCRRHIADMRRDFHRPEGYFTCLPIR